MVTTVYISSYYYIVGQPMPMQPMQPVVQWMAPPAAVSGVAPGLEYLTQVDQLLVHQQIEIMESKCCSVGNNRRAFSSRINCHKNLRCHEKKLTI